MTAFRGASEDWIFLGASNLARDFPRALATARRAVGAEGLSAPPRVWVATGHGRSYGTWSRVLARGLPGIAPSGLWTALNQRPEFVATSGRRRVLLTDVGNDLVYGASPEAIAGWVETCIERSLEGLERAQGGPSSMVLTLLPLASLRTLGPVQFQVLRTVFFPLHPGGFRDTLERAERLQELLASLARRHGLATVEPPAEWYGPDRIHLRPGARREAWEEMLRAWGDGVMLRRGEVASRPLSRPAWWRLTPERWRLAGFERGRSQPATTLADGTPLHLY